MQPRLSLNPEGRRADEAKHWAAFSDVALAMVLVFMLFILAQFLHYEQIFVLDEISRRKGQFHAAVDSTASHWDSASVQVLDEDGLHQRVRVIGELVFQPCRDDLSRSGRAVLDDLGSLLRQHREFFQSVEVEGHTDRQGATGTVCRQEGIFDNWQLSARRATEVVRLFAGSEVLPQEILSSVGRGESSPLSQPGDTMPEALARDRRIEIVLRYSEAAALSALGRDDDG